MKFRIILALLLCSLVGQAQIIQYPNPGLYGQGMRRGAWDSVVYLPTGCGVPVGKAGLRSYGFNGFGQKLNQIAIFGDTCGHHVYWYDPTDSTWARLDSAGSGGGGTGSADSLKHLFVDTSANPRNGYVLSFDSTNHKWKLIAQSGGGGTAYDSASSQSAAASGGFHTDSFNVRKFFKRSDTVGFTNPATNGHLKKVVDSLGGLTDTFAWHIAGQPGDTLIKVVGNTAVFPALRDSGSFHHYDNPDGSWTFFGATSGLLNTNTVSTLANLRTISYSGLTDSTVFLVSDTLRGGMFVWRSASTSVDDSVMVINPVGHSGAGRLLRVYFGPLQVTWWGADPTNTNNSTAAIQRGIDYSAASIHSINFRSGYYKVDSVLWRQTDISADNMFTTLAPTGTAVNGFVQLAAAPLNNSHWNYLRVGAPGGSYTGHGFNLTAVQQSGPPNTGGFWNSTISNIFINGFKGDGIHLYCVDGAGDMAHQMFMIDRVNVLCGSDSNARGIYIHGQANQWKITQIWLNGQMVTNKNTIGMVIESDPASNDQVVGGNSVDVITIQSFNLALKMDNVQGVDIAHVWLENDSNGVYIKNNSGLHIHNLHCANIANSSTAYLMGNDNSYFQWDMLDPIGGTTGWTEYSPGGAQRQWVPGMISRPNWNFRSTFTGVQVGPSANNLNVASQTDVLVPVSTGQSVYINSITSNLPTYGKITLYAYDATHTSGGIVSFKAQGSNIGFPTSYCDSGFYIMRDGDALELMKSDDGYSYKIIGAPNGSRYLSAAPTVGKYITGERFYNNNPTRGTAAYWVITKGDVTGGFTVDSVTVGAAQQNFGGAPGQLQGTYSGIPSATSYATGTTYIAQDSGFQYVDTGSGGSRGWKKIAGGGGSSGGGGSQNLQQVVAQHGSFSGNDSSNLAGRTWYVQSGMVKTDSITSNPGVKQTSDSLWGAGTSIMIGSAGIAFPYSRFLKLMANKYNVFEANYGIGGATLTTQGLANIPLIPVYSRAKYIAAVLDWGPNDIQASTTPDSTTFAGYVGRYIDSMTIGRGWPASRILWIAPGYIDSTLFPNATTLRQRQFKNAIIQVGASKSIKVFSMYDIEVARGWQTLLNADGLHPNEGGHGVYANAGFKVLGLDSVRAQGQVVAINGLMDVEKLRVKNSDSAGYDATLMGQDSNSRVVRFSKDDIMRSYWLTRGVPQSMNAGITGYFQAGNIAKNAQPASVSIYTPGTIQGGSMRITASPPAGWSGDGMNFSYSSNVGHIFGYTYGAGPSRAIAMNELGSPVLFGTATATGGPEIGQFNGGISATFGRFSSSVSGSGLTGSAAEIGMNGGTTAFLYGYNRTGGAGLNLCLGFGLSPFVIVGSNTVTGSLPFQVNSGAYINGLLGVGVSAATAQVDINRTVSSPTTGAKGVDFAVGASTYTFAVDQAQVVTASIDQKTHSFLSTHITTDASSFDITGAPIAGTNATITNPYAFRVKAGKSQFNGVVQIKDGTQSNGYVFTSDANGNGSWQAASGGSTNIYTTDGTLTGNRTLSGGGFNLNIGSTGSYLGAAVINATSVTLTTNGGVIKHNGPIVNNALGFASDANYTSSSDYAIVLPVITAARTVSLPTESTNAGREIVIMNRNTSGTFSWSFTNTVKDGTGSTITNLANSTVYRLYCDGTNYIKIN